MRSGRLKIRPTWLQLLFAKSSMAESQSCSLPAMLKTAAGNFLRVARSTSPNGGEPILLVARDAEDGGWQFLTGGAFDITDGMVVSLQNVFERDKTIAELADLEPGWQATRKKVGAPWKRSEQSEE
jgi:hypothetical protein